MNICFLLGSIKQQGGIGRVTSIIANNLSLNSKYKVYLLTFFDTNKNDSYQLYDNVKYMTLNSNKGSMTGFIINGGIKRTVNLLLSANIDVIIACGTLFYPLATLVSKKMNIKLICWDHSNTTISTDHRFQRLSRYYGASNSDMIVTLTKDDYLMYRKKHKSKDIFHIYNPIDNNFQSNFKYNACSKKILSIGRFSYQKNFTNLVDVARRVLNKNIEWEWHIYGDGNEFDKVQRRIKKYKLENRLLLMGRQNNLYEIYKNYSMLVMTSRYEGFPMVLIEGLQNKLPLISYDVKTGPSEIIEDGENGFLVKKFDTKGMSDRIIQLVNNDSLRITMSQSIKNQTSEFDLDKIMSKWNDVFSKIDGDD